MNSKIELNNGSCTSGSYTILIGEGIICDQDYKLIINARGMDINETMTGREWSLINSALNGQSEYYEKEIQRLNKLLLLRESKLRRILDNEKN